MSVSESMSEYKIKNVALETVCGVRSRLPDSRFPEFAFAGKSNVGKSSLINLLMNRKSLARTSAQPGKTQTINFYNVNDELYLVDLPGYGYTKASEHVKAEWGRMVERYLKKSRMLKCVFLLVDIRHKPTADDKLMYDWIVSEGFTPVIIATKADKLKKSEKPAALKLIRETLCLGTDGIIIPTSVTERVGADAIYEHILNTMGETPSADSQEQAERFL